MYDETWPRCTATRRGWRDSGLHHVMSADQKLSNKSPHKKADWSPPKLACQNFKNKFLLLIFPFDWIDWADSGSFCRFQVHNSTTHLYTVLRVHQPKSSLCPSPCIPPLPSSLAPNPPPGNHHTVIRVKNNFFKYTIQTVYQQALEKIRKRKENLHNYNSLGKIIDWFFFGT